MKAAWGLEMDVATEERRRANVCEHAYLDARLKRGDCKICIYCGEIESDSFRPIMHRIKCKGSKNVS